MKNSRLVLCLMSLICFSTLFSPIAQAHCNKKFCSKNLKPLVISGFSNPESIVADPRGGKLYVSNLGTMLAPSSKDKDGFISAVSRSGKLLSRKYFSGILNAPKGMGIVGNTLYVTDIDRVVGFDLQTRKQNLVIDFSKTGTKFLNDLEVADANTLLVSATDVGKIYRIDLSKKTYTPLADLVGANGLSYDQSKHLIYAVSFGEGMKLNGSFGKLPLKKKNAKFKQLSQQAGGFDGVVKVGNQLLISDWVAFDKSGVIWAYDLKTKKISKIETSTLKGPADFYYDQSANQLWIPCMLEGKVKVVKLCHKH